MTTKQSNPLEAACSLAFDLNAGRLEAGPVTYRYLSDLAGFFVDEAAYQQARNEGDPLVYQVSAVEPAHSPADLHIGLGVVMPGQIGREYYLTKGHLHEKRESAEIYIGLEGKGVMVLEDEETGNTTMQPLNKHRIVYVPGHTAHRTCNIGDQPLKYLGVYAADAGHDYGAIAERNFHKVVVAGRDGAELIDRDAYTPELP
jgi:glucose-6-phosphate isomerase